jgi:hypothetical protein
LVAIKTGIMAHSITIIKLPIIRTVESFEASSAIIAISRTARRLQIPIKRYFGLLKQMNRVEAWQLTEVLRRKL